ncbi:PhzF family phenazine biosynthesis protein [Undibacterium fentianense]|uniref:PhzF family phenazine biosynthesis protein n=1 Tax=Undibacterium fentianense TaxID=2828728 RepID=A0A941E1V9_9BURK|nr:PhzF family phenazine biosynthesis protein [Undibacterium fentianense]MBR7800840.1 PhzF family phenazine biosynthesis protein [Undibacterium fentianense]
MNTTSIFRVAAFSDKDQGGNPAGVWLGEALPEPHQMQAIAKDVGYSETVFACRLGDHWQVRFFSPESEVPFCGHATIALGAILAQEFGDDQYELQLSAGQISVSGQVDENTISASLQSPPTKSTTLENNVLASAMELFGLRPNDLDLRIPSALIHGGADHLLLCLQSRQTLRDMKYNFDLGRDFMQRHGLVTIMLVVVDNQQLFHSRNAFAYGGVYEDPATGAASAAFAGYLRDIHWPHQGNITLIQGEDMGMRSVIHAEFSEEPGTSIRIYGTARLLTT